MTCFESWKGLKQGFRLTRIITRHGKTTEEVVCGITSLSPEQADASRLLELVRSHRGNENQLQLYAGSIDGRGCLHGSDGSGSPSDGGFPQPRRLFVESTTGDSHPDIMRRLAAQSHEILRILNPQNSIS